MLHGLGADGNDLIGLAPYLAPALPGVAFVSPNAPYPCDMAPVGRQWFSLRDRDPQVMGRELEAAAPILQDFIDEEIERSGLPSHKVALLGFSQGTMMSLFVAPRRDAPLAGVLGFSGALFGGHSLRDEIASKPPVMLIHGTSDEVVPVQAMALAVEGLESVGVPVESIERPGLGHGIDEDGLVHGAGFLKKILGL
jgi:phospholipase/carboxylesterase